LVDFGDEDFEAL
jgi:hypothetical protein